MHVQCDARRTLKVPTVEGGAHCSLQPRLHLVNGLLQLLARLPQMVHSRHNHRQALHWLSLPAWHPTSACLRPISRGAQVAAIRSDAPAPASALPQDSMPPARRCYVLACISSTMSQPPSSSPRTYTCTHTLADGAGRVRHGGTARQQACHWPGCCPTRHCTDWCAAQHPCGHLFTHRPVLAAPPRPPLPCPALPCPAKPSACLWVGRPV